MIRNDLTTQVNWDPYMLVKFTWLGLLEECHRYMTVLWPTEATSRIPFLINFLSTIGVTLTFFNCHVCNQMQQHVLLSYRYPTAGEENRSPYLTNTTRKIYKFIRNRQRWSTKKKLHLQKENRETKQQKTSERIWQYKRWWPWNTYFILRRQYMHDILPSHWFPSRGE